MALKGGTLDPETLTYAIKVNRLTLLVENRWDK